MESHNKKMEKNTAEEWLEDAASFTLATNDTVSAGDLCLISDWAINDGSDVQYGGGIEDMSTADIEAYLVNRKIAEEILSREQGGKVKDLLKRKETERRKKSQW